MNKDVVLTIKGLQYSLADGDDQRIETINRGVYAFRNGKHFVVYDEAIEGTTETTQNMIKFTDSFVEVNKKGAFGVNLMFEPGTTNVTNYSTPFGNLTVGIKTNEMKVDIGEDEINILVCYDMDINYEFVANCKIEISLQSVVDNKPIE